MNAPPLGSVTERSIAGASAASELAIPTVSKDTWDGVFYEYISQDEGSSVWEFHNFTCFLRCCKLFSESFSHYDALAIWRKVTEEIEEPTIDSDEFSLLLSEVAVAFEFSSVDRLYNEILANQVEDFQYDNMDPILQQFLPVGHRREPLIVLRQYMGALKALFAHYRTAAGVTARNMFRLCTALHFIPDVVVPPEVVQICRAILCGHATLSDTCAAGLYSRRNVADAVAASVRWFENESAQVDLMASPAACINPIEEASHGEPIYEFPQFLDVILCWILYSAPPMTRDNTEAEVEERIHQVLNVARLPQVLPQEWTPRDHLESWNRDGDDSDDDVWLLLDEQLGPLPPEPRNVTLTHPKPTTKFAAAPPTVEEVVAKKAAEAAAAAAKKKKKKKVEPPPKPEPKWGELQYCAKRAPPPQGKVPASLARHRVAELESKTRPCAEIKEPVRALCIVESLNIPEEIPMDFLVLIEAAAVKRNAREYSKAVALLLKARTQWHGEGEVQFMNVEHMMDELEEMHPSTTLPIEAEVYIFLTLAALADALEYEETSLMLLWKIKTFAEKTDPESLIVGVILDHIGIFAFRATAYDISARCYLTVCKLREKRIGDSVPTAVAYHNLGASYFQMDRNHEAGAYLELAYAIFQFSLGDANSRTMTCKRNLDKVKQSYTKPLLAVPHIFYIPYKTRRAKMGKAKKKVKKKKG